MGKRGVVPYGNVTLTPLPMVPGEPWQLDWIFSSPDLTLVSCDVADSAEIRALSDHSPVIAEFEV